MTKMRSGASHLYEGAKSLVYSTRISVDNDLSKCTSRQAREGVFDWIWHIENSGLQRVLIALVGDHNYNIETRYGRLATLELEN